MPSREPAPTATGVGRLDDGLADADRAADAALTTWLAAVEARDEPFEGLPFAALGASLPDGALLWAGNSMPCAIWTTGWRGASERSGRCPTAARTGSTASCRPRSGRLRPRSRPVVLVVGDVSFLHDLNALVSARLHYLSATIVLVDNDGGGIFSFLPQATTDAPEVGLPDFQGALRLAPTASTSGRS